MTFRSFITGLLGTAALFTIFGNRIPGYGQVYYPTSESAHSLADKKAIYHSIKSGAAKYASDKDSALLSILNGIEASRALKFEDGIFTGYFLLGVLYIYQGDYNTAGEWLEKAAEQAQVSGKIATNICRALNNLGNIQHFQGNYQQAAAYYFQAINIAETALQRQQDTDVINPLIRLYTSTANALLQLDEDQKAGAFLNKAELLAQKMGYKQNLPAIYVNKSIIYKKEKNYKLAWNYNQEALAIARKFDLDEPEHIALQNLGALYISKGKHKEALTYLRKALEIKGYVNPLYEIQTLLYLGITYRSLKSFRDAEQYLLSAHQKAQALKLPAQLLQTHQQLSVLYKHTGQYHQAYEHQSVAYQINDSLLNYEKATAVNLLEIKYRTAEKEKELSHKQLLINNQQRILEKKNIWIIGISSGALLLTAILGLVFSLYHSNKQKHRLQSEKMRNLQKQQEINLLKALMEGEEKERVRIAQDLHDGIVVQFTAAKMNFRSLTNHYKILADSTAFKQAVEQLDHATRNLRQTAHNLLPDILLEEGLAEAVYYFCKNIKQTPGLKIDFQLYGQIPRLAPDFELSVYRIIQELTHNVIKHAQAQHALVQITCKDQHLSITVEDDGIGIPPAFLNNKKGIGLRSIHTRVQTLRGHIDVRSHPNNGTIVYIEFDIQHSLTPLIPAYDNPNSYS